MLRLDPLLVEHPTSIEEAVVLLERHGATAKVCAGGTDLLPNLKHGLHAPEVLVHIGRVRGLRGIVDRGDTLEIGALTTLHALTADPLVQRHAPGLARAAAQVAGPQLRRMGTLGGNLCLDTRCLYYNQTYFWREALGFCLKKDGSVCHVVAGGKKCVAAASNDTATMLLALGAAVEIASAAGTRTLALDDFYVADGTHNTVLTDGDLLTRVRVPKAANGTVGRHEGYAKLRHRQSIDYPLLAVAVRADVDAAGLVQQGRVVVSALQAKPQRLDLTPFVGQPANAATRDAIATLAHQRCHPLTNVADDPAWRKDMVPVFVRRAWDDAFASA